MPIRFIKAMVKKLTRGKPPADARGAAPQAAKEHRAHAPKPEPRAHAPARPAPRRERHEKRPPAHHAPAVPDRAAAPAAPAPRHPPRPWTLDDFQVAPKEGAVRFHDFSLPPEIMHAIADMKFQYCTPIQAEVLPYLESGRNLTGRAQTGTGKTAAFLITIFDHFLKHPRANPAPGAPRALVLAPTRELVVQIIKDAHALGRHSSFRSMAVYGGIDYVKQKQEVLRGPIDLVAATPGRLLDFLNQHVLDLKHVEILVLDEADRMLDMGFIPDVKRIISKLPPKEKRRTLLFSATLSEDVMRLARQWMPDPVTVEMAAEQVTVDRIRQRILIVTVRDKFRILVNMLRRPEMKRVLVFANRRDTARELSEALRKQGIHCQLISGEVEQGKRQRILEDFRAGRIQAMIATDVAARGLHIDNVSHVINFDLPYEPQDYVHRIGRTGRAGLEGESISFADEESFVLPDIEKFIGKALPCEQPEESLLADLPY